MNERVWNEQKAGFIHFTTKQKTWRNRTEAKYKTKKKLLKIKRPNWSNWFVIYSLVF